MPGAPIHSLSTLDLIDRRSPDKGDFTGRVCIVTGEIAGPDYNGGIGTANRGLALSLRNAGFAVDVLYTRVEAPLGRLAWQVVTGHGNPADALI